MNGLVESSADARSKTIGQNFRCRAWVNFNGTGTVAIRDSRNVSSITDNGTGDYTVNFTTDMPDANYSAVGSPNYARLFFGIRDIASGSVRFTSYDEGSTSYYDSLNTCVSIFR